MYKIFILCFLLIISVHHVNGQEYDSAKSLNYSEKVKKVYETDSVNGSIVVKKFNSNGYLIFSSSKTSDYIITENIKFKDSVILQKNNIYKYENSESESSEIYTYIINKLVGIELVDKGRNEDGKKYTKTISKHFEYDNQGKAVRSYSSFSSGRKESVELYYGQEDGLVRVKNINDDSFHSIEKEYRKEDVVKNFTYENSSSEPLVEKIWKLNKDKNVDSYIEYVNSEVVMDQKNIYLNGLHVSSEIFQKNLGSYVLYYNSYGDIEKSASMFKDIEYKYIYNKNGDAVETRTYANGKLVNVIITEYEYWK